MGWGGRGGEHDNNTKSKYRTESVPLMNMGLITLPTHFSQPTAVHAPLVFKILEGCGRIKRWDEEMGTRGG